MAKKTESTMQTSDFNLQRLNTKDLGETISASIAAGSNIAIFGRRGTGKTEISKQEIAKAKVREIYINLSVLERPDLGGYPRIMSNDMDRKFVDFLLPNMYEHLIEGTQKCVVLLDEVDKADPSLWAPLLEFTQFHTINARKLPNLHAIIMTGNLISEGGQRPSLPLLDRAEKYIVEADASAWLEWAGKSGKVHPSITAYITDHPKDLFGAIDPEDRYADSSPRGWANASKLLFIGENLGWNKDVLNKKVSGCVGKEVGIKYSHYYDHYQVLLPMVNKIFEGQSVVEQFNALEPTKKLVACMIACARLSNHLDDAGKGKAPKSLEYVGKFLQKVPLENVLVSVRTQIQLSRIVQWDLDDSPHWKPVLDKITNAVY
jgi:hypothetical protein